MSTNEFALSGYEDLEISTQILIRDALNRDVSVSVLDRSSNFLELRKGDKKEYVKQATKTSRDSYITFLIMENKSVTKSLLDAAELRVPEGKTFTDPDDALLFCQNAPWDRFVVKPVTTNFGIGITIVDAKSDPGTFANGVEKAFSFADSVLVEEFVPGDEYRFLVVGPETIAVCRRIPANVLGDGVSSIRELVAAKNDDPRRGTGHTTPLEKIELGETELTVLREDYDFDFDSVPKEGVPTYLRRNSNISTGGDSIDCTDSIDSYYKEIARKAAATVEAKICGVDLIVPNPSAKGAYAILELNFNPVLYIHDYPYEGLNRHVGEKILDLLGF